MTPRTHQDHDDAVRGALEAVVAVVEADTVRRIVEWLRDPDYLPYHLVASGDEFARRVERKFSGVTQPEERAA